MLAQDFALGMPLKLRGKNDRKKEIEKSFHLSDYK